MLISCLETQCEDKQTDIRRDAERRHNSDDIATRPELFAMQSVCADFGKELLVSCLPISLRGHETACTSCSERHHTLLSPKQTDE
jgi:hypothetical protein